MTAALRQRPAMLPAGIVQPDLVRPIRLDGQAESVPAGPVERVPGLVGSFELPSDVEGAGLAYLTQAVLVGRIVLGPDSGVVARDAPRYRVSLRRRPRSAGTDFSSPVGLPSVTTAQPSPRRTGARLLFRITQWIRKHRQVKLLWKSLWMCWRRRFVRLDGEGWRTFFDSYQKEAFRLETLPSYSVGSEQAEYETFLATGKVDIPDDDSWLVRVRRFRRTGRWIGRVHVISRPLTEYLRYEFAVYRRTVEVGEDVRILDLTDQPNPGLPTQDFWLFDDTAVVRMDYAPDGTALGRELLDGVDPAPYVAWKRLALESSEPFTENQMKLEG